MRRVILLVITACILAGSGCAVKESDFTVNVTGTPGLEFAGNYLVMMANGDNRSQSVDGKVPATYFAAGKMISCVFQKKSEPGRLTVEISKSGRTISQSSTLAEEGIVSIATQ